MYVVVMPDLLLAAMALAVGGDRMVRKPNEASGLTGPWRATDLVSARKLPSSSRRCSITRAREREWDIRRRQSVSSVILSSFVRSLR